MFKCRTCFRDTSPEELADTAYNGGQCERCWLSEHPDKERQQVSSAWYRLWLDADRLLASTAEAVHIEATP